MLYAIQNAAALDADLVIEEGNDTYVCSLNPALYKANSGTPIELQNIWRIKKITTKKTTEQTATVVLYPDGSNEFAFTPSEIENYNFQFRK